MDLYALWLLGSARGTNPNIVVEASLSCPCKPPQHVHGPSSIPLVTHYIQFIICNQRMNETNLNRSN